MIWETKAVSLWTYVIWDIAQKISLFRFLAQFSPFWVSLWKLLWSGGRTTTRQSRLHRNSFSKSSLCLTLSHSSPRVQITTAAPTLRRRSKRAGCSSIHRELSRRRRKGAAEPMDKGSCAARRTLSFSLSLFWVTPVGFQFDEWVNEQREFYGLTWQWIHRDICCVRLIP